MGLDIDAVRGALRALADHIAAEGDQGPYVAEVVDKYLDAMARSQDSGWAAYYADLGIRELATGAVWLQEPDGGRGDLVGAARERLAAWEAGPDADAQLKQWQQEHGVTDEQILRKDGPAPR